MAMRFLADLAKHFGNYCAFATVAFRQQHRKSRCKMELKGFQLSSVKSTA